jgi:hypothetical protein
MIMGQQVSVVDVQNKEGAYLGRQERITGTSGKAIDLGTPIIAYDESGQRLATADFQEALGRHELEELVPLKTLAWLSTRNARLS